MTISAAPLPVFAEPVDLTDTVREACLQWLAGEWSEDHPRPEHGQLLAGWAHKSLTRIQREELFGEYRATLLLAAGLSDETEPWHQYAPDLASRRPEDRQAIAAERAEKDAAKLLHTLMNGTGE